MSKLIDADDFRREIDKHWPFTKEEQCKHGIADMAKSELLYVLNQMPTIEERKKGKWIIDDEYIDCSVCRHEKWSRVPYEDLVKRFKFCPNCGARMKI